MIMSYLRIYFVLFSILLFIISCGQDGDDGEAFIAFNWSTTPEWYWDDNTSVPGTISKNRNYNTNPGTYDFSYEIYDSWNDVFWIYNGTYIITIDKGKKGTFLVDGPDGADNYFKLYLGTNGPDFEIGKMMPNTEIEKLTNGNELIKSLEREKKAKTMIEEYPNKNTQNFFKERVFGNLKVELEYKKYRNKQ